MQSRGRSRPAVFHGYRNYGKRNMKALQLHSILKNRMNGLRVWPGPGGFVAMCSILHVVRGEIRSICRAWVTACSAWISRLTRSNAQGGKLPGKERIFSFCRRTFANFPVTKIALIPLLISDVSILSMSTTAVLMLLHFIGTAGREQSPSCAPSGGAIAAARDLLL